MWRSIGAIVAGVIAAVVVVGLVETLGHFVYPPPRIDLSDPQQLRTIIEKLPRGALVSVLLAWGAGSLVGGFVAAAIADKRRLIHALIVGSMQMTAGIGTMLAIPHPMWFVGVSFVIFIPASCLGAWLAMQFVGHGPAGPQPYDMREKNMAC
jgi:hypothetical protein